MLGRRQVVVAAIYTIRSDKVRKMKRVGGIFGDPLLYCEGRQGHKNVPFLRGMRAHSETNVSIGLMGSMALDEKIPPT